jgi:hypothetical protein
MRLIFCSASERDIGPSSSFQLEATPSVSAIVTVLRISLAVSINTTDVIDIPLFLLPNERAHLPPVIARQLSHQATKLAKMPLRTHAEGGQVEPVLGCISLPLPIT